MKTSNSVLSSQIVNGIFRVLLTVPPALVALTITTEDTVRDTSFKLHLSIA